MTRLLIIADHALGIQAIRMALPRSAGFDVVGFLDGRASVGARLLQLQPDVVVVDDTRNPDDALVRLREVVEHLPRAQVVLLARGPDERRLDDIFDAGAHVVLSKAIHPAALGTLLRETVRGNVIHRPRRVFPAGGHHALTQREVEILGLAALGHTNGRIARDLWITEQTVKFHLSNTYRKLGVANRTEATRFAYASGLIELGPARRVASRAHVAADAA